MVQQVSASPTVRADPKSIDKGQESALWERYIRSGRKDRDIEDTLTRQYLPRVNRIAYSLQRSGTIKGYSSSELVSYGLVGLLTAIRRFNPQEGTNFDIYCRKRITGEIIDSVRSNCLINRELIKLTTYSTRLKAAFEGSFERAPSDHETALLLIAYNHLKKTQSTVPPSQEVILSKLPKMLDTVRSINRISCATTQISLDEKVGDTSLRSYFPEAQEDHPEPRYRVKDILSSSGFRDATFRSPRGRAASHTSQAENWDLIRPLLRDLTEKERLCFSLSRGYGYKGGEIADLLRISKDTAYQHIFKATRKLTAKHPLSESTLDKVMPDSNKVDTPSKDNNPDPLMADFAKIWRVVTPRLHIRHHTTNL